MSKSVSDFLWDCAGYSVLWSSLKNQTVLISGGTGFLGSPLVGLACEANIRFNLNLRLTLITRSIPKTLARFPSWSTQSTISLVEVDVCNPFSLNGSYSACILGAVDSSNVGGLYSNSKIDVILKGTRNCLEFCRIKSIQKILFLSSGAVYECSLTQGGQNLSEDIKLHTPIESELNDYAHAKLMAESMCSNFHKQYGVDFTIARCFAFVGPSMPVNAHFAIGNFIRDALYSDSVVVKGDGLAVRSYLYTFDCAFWLWSLLVSASGIEVVNVGSDVGMTILEIATIVRNLLSPSKSIDILSTSTLVTRRNYYLPDISRARLLHGLEVWTSLEHAIKATALHHDLGI
ncbi:NAD-dependent epimerase/dehydratase family protein [Cyanobium sp. ATX 6F1]|uniref:NAD-dependent epimerase/dehydratase family protein n=1 Tax=unclassified Cyanobium TaxID=2627006 RepID=UPI0020CDDE60|nr:NAD(P)-dependent oxidoreductase [Cyanobium sp. ATX 6F1]MCP9915159.1 NAD(P)-dependent oxidoreductase [Cyanobium sp. ATX 6F1]